jgi:hypothetical protein
MNHKLWQTGIAVTLLATLTACVNQQERTKREIQQFMSYVAGEYVSQAGDTLVVAPVYARMVAMDTVYVERTSGQGTSGKLIELAPGKNGSILQVAYAFTQQSQWRNLREQPELFSALLPKDVRAAGTCDIKLAADRNSLDYSCGGSKPVSFTRVLHGNPN